MASLRSLKPNVTREEAMQQFSRGAISHCALLCSARCARWPSFLFPSSLFRVEILNGGRRELQIFGLDAVTGFLDLYRFEQIPGESEVVCLETRNRIPVALDEDAEKIWSWPKFSGCFSPPDFSACVICNFPRSPSPEKFTSPTGWDFAAAALEHASWSWTPSDEEWKEPKSAKCLRAG